jgi:hypothetical protein
VTDRIRSQHGNVIAADFSRPNKKVGSIEISVSVETIYADDRIVVLRCAFGNHVWHMLGDLASAKVIST